MSPLTASKPAGASEPWPHPRWIAHRGAGTLAPENTWAAFDLGAHWGFRMFECDIRLSADGVWFLMHDDTLERTTNGHGLAQQQPWADLCDLDAGAWHSPQHAGQRLPTLDALLVVAQQRGWCLNLELKPPEDPTTARRWGVELGLWLNQHPHGLDHWVTSFSTDALAGLQAAAPHVRRGHLFEAWSPGVLSITQALGCEALVLDHTAWEAQHAQAARDAGLWTLAYTVNEPAHAERLWAMGLDALITDRVDLFHPKR